MKIRYNQYSVIGKVWTIGEMFYMGVRDVKQSYVNATIRKLEELEREEHDSNAVKQHSFECMLDSVSKILKANTETNEDGNLIYDGSIVTTVWYNCLAFNEIKNKAKNEELNKDDVAGLDDLLQEIKRLWLTDLKTKNLSSLERKDLFTIKKEIEAFTVRLDTKIRHGAILLGE